MGKIVGNCGIINNCPREIRTPANKIKTKCLIFVDLKSPVRRRPANEFNLVLKP